MGSPLPAHHSGSGVRIQSAQFFDLCSCQFTPPRFRRFEGFPYHSNRLGVQDVLDVCYCEYRWNGDVFAVRSSLSAFLLHLTHSPNLRFYSVVPETKGRSLEEMDVIFGSISQEQRQADINKQEKGLLAVL